MAYCGFGASLFSMIDQWLSTVEPQECCLNVRIDSCQCSETLQDDEGATSRLEG